VGKKKRIEKESYPHTMAHLRGGRVIFGSCLCSVGYLGELKKESKVIKEDRNRKKEKKKVKSKKKRKRKKRSYVDLPACRQHRRIKTQQNKR